MLKSMSADNEGKEEIQKRNWNRKKPNENSRTEKLNIWNKKIQWMDDLNSR